MSLKKYQIQIHPKEDSAFLVPLIISGKYSKKEAEKKIAKFNLDKANIKVNLVAKMFTEIIERDSQ